MFTTCKINDNSTYLKSLDMWMTRGGISDEDQQLLSKMTRSMPDTNKLIQCFMNNEVDVDIEFILYLYNRLYS